MNQLSAVISTAPPEWRRPNPRCIRSYLPRLTAFFLLTLLGVCYFRPSFSRPTTSWEATVARCQSLHTPAGPPASFHTSSRVTKGSDRHVPGTPPTVIHNAKIWTAAGNGSEIIHGDILLDRGIIVAVGHIPRDVLKRYDGGNRELRVLDVGGKWITPGLVDLHSHIGVSSAPYLSGAADTNSRKAPILPWLRSIDGLNTHDASYELAIAGGVTTVQVLPGSANNIGGQSFLIKLRPTSERSATSKVLEPPKGIVGNITSDHLHWRHMKHACGENPDRLYAQSRMDAAWNFRQAYDTARKIKESQDAFCTRVLNVESRRGWRNLFGPRKNFALNEEFPENLQWESLVDVLRGRVKLSIHCYEAVDLDAIIRLSNEFKFPIASLHHAGETYLVPDLLKKAWGGVPTIALFASNARKKREAYRGSEFAPRVLAQNEIPVVMKSDHPVLNSRYLLFEAQQAHYYGLDSALALMSVTSTPAKAAGVGHRIGTIAEGFDADIAVWDSHPLALGATPTQVYIDGIAQLVDPHVSTKPAQAQNIPKTPNWDREAQRTVDFEGLPPLRGRRIKLHKRGVKFVGVKSAWITDEDGQVRSLFDEEGVQGEERVVFMREGNVACVSREGEHNECEGSDVDESVEVIDLQGGSLAPGLTSFGSPLGLVEIRLEPSTNDGPVIDPLVDGGVPKIVGGSSAVIRAVDGLQFEGRNTLLAYRGGVTRAVTAPVSAGFMSGLSTTFDIGAAHAVEQGAIVQAETALHVAINLLMGVSVSTQVATLRRLLHGSTSKAWTRVREESMTLVVAVDSADIMATLLNLKSEYEASSGKTLSMSFSGASEAHLLAHEIANANVSVILTSRPYPGFWEKRRILPGPPLSQHSQVTALLDANVNVALGVIDEYNARNTRFETAWVALESNGLINKTEAISLVTTHLSKALGATMNANDIVAYRGGDLFDMQSKVIGVVSRVRGSIELF